MGRQSPKTKLAEDREVIRKKAVTADLGRRYKTALEVIARLEQQLEAALKVSKHRPQVTAIQAKNGDGGASEATAFIIASDWHIEEYVNPATVNGLNEYTLDIAKNRAEQFFRHGLRLTNIMAKDIGIETIVLALLGDVISNDIHEELAETNQLSPMEAILTAQDWITSGITFLLKESHYNLVIPCPSGNHARTTPKNRVATEKGHSLEFFMYNSLAKYFRNEPRVSFLIAQGHNSYLQVYDMTVRF